MHGVTGQYRQFKTDNSIPMLEDAIYSGDLFVVDNGNSIIESS